MIRKHGAQRPQKPWGFSGTGGHPMTPTPRKAFIQASLRDWRETAQTGVHFSHGETDAVESGPGTRHIIYIQVNNPFVFAFSRESGLQPKSGFLCVKAG